MAHLLPSLRMKRLFLGSFVNGIGRTRSGLSGLVIVRLKIFTSGSLVAAFQHKTFHILDLFSEIIRGPSD